MASAKKPADELNVLGLHFFHANASAAVFVDGQLIASAEEERFNRVKFSAGIPLSSIAFCLKAAGLEFKDIDSITYPRSTNTRIVNKDQIHYQDRIYRISSLYDRYRMNLKLINFKETLAQHFDIPVETLVFKLREEDHHLSHMMSGFHYSPFDEALLISCDAFGDFVSLKTGVGRGSHVEILDQVQFPHSLGLFYTMVTQFLGFPGYGDESKVMGLSTFGYPEFTDRLRTIIGTDNRKVKLDLKYFDADKGVETSWAEQTPDIGRLFNDNLTHLMGPQRQPDAAISGSHQNIAASLQHLTEEALFSVIEELFGRYPIPNLVFTGGLAYNSLLNGRILGQTEVDSVYIPPAPGNSGLALGSALTFMGPQVSRIEMTQAFWGPDYSWDEIAEVLKSKAIPFTQLSNPVSKAVDLLAEGQTLGWFQGRMEFGPRSLGNRSILINPLTPNPQRIKRRDYLKPFGISILEDSTAHYFRDAHPSPFMSFMEPIRGKHRRDFENVLLNNYCRYQTVGPESPLFYALLNRFRERTGLPFLINTSLNPEGEPIVASPQHFVDGVCEMHLDAAILGNLLVSRPFEE